MPDYAGTGAPYVFLSYASTERPRALQVADALEAAGVRVWIDRQAIAGGTSWGSEIVEGIKGCAALAICCSAAALASRNVKQEIQLAWRFERAYLPLLLEPVAFPEQVLYFLEGWQWVELLDRPAADWLPAVLKALARLGVQGAAPTPAALAAAAQPDATATAPAATSAAVAVPQPSGSGVFVGRTPELAKLSAALEGALARHGRLLFLAGEPGIGKTRTAQELAATARQRGALVLWGRCWEGEGAPAFFPWTEALRTAVRGTDTAILTSLPAGVAGDLCRLLPELRGLLPDGIPAAETESEEGRFRLFEAVVTLVEALTAHRPLLLVLDDLHWADKPSLLLLQYLARRLEGLPLLVLGTYRDTELDRKHPLAEVLATLRRTGAVERVPLSGLTTAEVASFVVATLDQELSERGRVLVEALHRETEGNPFFLQETLQHLIESGGLVRREGRWTSDARDIGALGIPEGVREVIGRRLARLSEACNTLLSIAAVIGRDFAAETLLKVGGVDESTLDAALAEAEAARLIGAVTGAVDRYRFSHALVREALYAELPLRRRVRLHRQIGEALEAQHTRNPEAHLAELAYHFLEGSPGGDVEKAIAYATRAGDRALGMYAYEEAARHYTGALAALEQAEAADEERECRLLLALAHAEGRAGAVTEAKAHFQRVAAVARRLARSDLLAAAAWGFNALPQMEWIVDAERVAFTEEALAAVGDGDSVWRARLLGSLAAAVYFAGDPGRPPALTAEAVAIARRLNDPETLQNALFRRCMALRGPDHLPETLAATAELIGLVAGAGDAELEFRAHSWRKAVYLYRGEMAAFGAETATMERLADVARQPNLRWLVLVNRGMLAFMAGDLAEAERLAGEVRTEGDRAQIPATTVWYIANLYYVRIEQGRLGELEGAVTTTFAPLTAPSVRTFLPHVALQTGREAEARDEFERQAADGFAVLAGDPGDQLPGLCFLADVCAGLGDADRARSLYTQLLPYRGLASAASGGIGCFGSVAFRLGLLARTRGVLEVAVADFEAGLALEERMGARPYAARSRYELARTLLARAAPGDDERARTLLAEALAEARAIGMTKLVDEIAAGGPHLLLSSSPVPTGEEDDPVVDVRGPGC